MVWRGVKIDPHLTTHTCGLVLVKKKVFMAGLQGEAGGDVRFNSEGDAVSNLLTHTWIKGIRIYSTINILTPNNVLPSFGIWTICVHFGPIMAVSADFKHEYRNKK